MPMIRSMTPSAKNHLEDPYTHCRAAHSTRSAAPDTSMVSPNIHAIDASVAYGLIRKYSPITSRNTPTMSQIILPGLFFI